VGGRPDHLRRDRRICRGHSSRDWGPGRRPRRAAQPLLRGMAAARRL